MLVVAALAITVPSAAARAQATYDLILRNGRVLDGTGNPWMRADVAITGNRIAAVGDLSKARARRTIDLAGLYLAPGFIDAHSHAGEGLTTPELGAAQPLVAQGVTTVIINPDGGGPVDLAAQRQALLRSGLGVNVAQLVPHGSIRSQVLGMQDRAPTGTELERMKALVRTGMEQGAFGLSSGPYYAPGSYSSTEELVALARVAGEHGGVYTSHIRDEGDFSIGVVAAVDEVIRIAREAKLPGIVTHIKALGPHVWGFSDTLVRRIERARAEGVEVLADQYPYDASSTSLTGAIFPRWAQVGGDSALRRRIDDPTERARLRADILQNLDRRGGADKLQFTRHRPDTSIEGKTLAAVAAARGLEPVDAAMEIAKRGGASVVSFNMSEGDIRAFMRQPWTMTSSDGGLSRMDVGVPHPRSYGTFPRKIRRYVLDEPVVDLGAAIRSMTSLPATVFHLTNRGQIREGATADLVVFDLQRVRDRAEYARPHQLSEGMVHVLVNGRFVIENGAFTGARPGEVLSRRAAAGGASASTGARTSGMRTRAASATP
jgi:N-acyl-D-aspartate/D-glutamate deacylase